VGFFGSVQQALLGTGASRTIFVPGEEREIDKVLVNYSRTGRVWGDFKELVQKVSSRESPLHGLYVKGVFAQLLRDWDNVRTEYQIETSWQIGEKKGISINDIKQILCFYRRKGYWEVVPWKPEVVIPHLIMAVGKDTKALHRLKEVDMYEILREAILELRKNLGSSVTGLKVVDFLCFTHTIDWREKRWPDVRESMTQRMTMYDLLRKDKEKKAQQEKVAAVEKKTLYVKAASKDVKPAEVKAPKKFKDLAKSEDTKAAPIKSTDFKAVAVEPVTPTQLVIVRKSKAQGKDPPKKEQRKPVGGRKVEKGTKGVIT
jgi:hypothetical protein